MKFYKAEEYQPAVSKGDLDIFVGVDAGLFESSIPKIESLGYQIKPDTLRTKSLCMLQKINSPIDIAVQLVKNASENEMFLAFRDLLKTNHDLIDQYNRLKLKCSGMDENEYRALKSEFIEALLRKQRPYDPSY